MKIDIKTVTVEELLNLDYQAPQRQQFNSVVIVPLNGELHESGFRKMKFIYLKRDGEVAGVCGGSSDVLHLDGIGGYGQDWATNMDERKVPISAWSIDCLPNGCLRLFARRPLVAPENSLSDAEVFAVYRHKE